MSWNFRNNWSDLEVVTVGMRLVKKRKEWSENRSSADKYQETGYVGICINSVGIQEEIVVFLKL